MNWKKNLIRFFGKTLILLLMLLLVVINYSSSQFIDLEVSQNNTLKSGVLDLFLTGSSFNSAGLMPGNSVSQSLVLDKTVSGNPLFHHISYEEINDPNGLCSQLDLSIVYTNSSGSYPLINQKLTSFYSYQNANFVLPDPLDAGSQNFTYTISVPADIGEQYENTSCQFNLVFKAYQQNSDGSWGFIDEEKLSNNLIATGNYAPPQPPTGLHILDYQGNDLGCGGITANRQITVDWNDNTESDFDHYNYYIKDNHNPLRTLTLSQFTGNIRNQDGHYRYCVEAVDKAGNYRHVCEMDAGFNPLNPNYWCSVTLDRGAPVTSFYTSNSPLRQIKEDLKNGDFENTPNHLEYWNLHGEVESLQSETIEGVEFSAADIPGSSSDNYMLKISPNSIPEEDLYYSSVSQIIPNSAKTLSFWYNFVTRDWLDNPGFSVFINEKEIFQVWAQDIMEYEPLAYSGWQKFYYDLNSFNMDEHPLLTLVFYSGNRYDSALDSWVYLDKISTNDVYINAQTHLILKASDAYSSTETFYKLGSCQSQLPSLPYIYGETGFTISAPPQDNKFCYGSSDALGNSEKYHEVNLIYDNNPPDAIDDLAVAVWGDGSYKLSWTAVDPNDEITGNKTAAYYLVKYVEDEGGDNLNTIELTESNFNQASDYWAGSPRLGGENDELEIIGLATDKTYHFAVKACDSASNCSSISNVATGLPTGASAAVSEVIFNELMWMGSEGNLYDEWIELKNTTTDKTINLKDWQIIKRKTDGTETCMFTFPNFELKPQELVVVSEYDSDHSAINVPCPGPNCLVVGSGATNDIDFSLANNRLQLKLYNGYWVLPTVSLIDVADDGVGAPAAGKYDSENGVYYSMERNDNPGNGADASSWHSCDNPASTALYWDSGRVERGTPLHPNMSLNKNNKEIYLFKKEEGNGFIVLNGDDNQASESAIIPKEVNLNSPEESSFSGQQENEKNN